MTLRTAAEKTRRVDVSVVCSPGQYTRHLAAVHEAFHEHLVATGRTAEFVYVLAGGNRHAEEELATIREDVYPVRILRMPKGFDMAAALQFAFEQAGGDYIITMPDRFQIDPAVLPTILERLDAGAEVVLTHREPRQDALINRLQSALFHWLMRGVYHRSFKDLTCGLRGFTRESARKLDLYGDLHRFIPILAAKRGFRIEEIPGLQRQEDRAARVFAPGVYARRLLDVLQVFFLTRFTSKPLRFFGVIGMILGVLGLAICSYLAFNRIFAGEALADRPLLLLGALLLVVGVQVTSTGLIGEIVIFFSSDRGTPEVEEIDPDDL